MEGGLANLLGKAYEERIFHHTKKENELTKNFCLMIYIYNNFVFQL